MFSHNADFGGVAHVYKNNGFLSSPGTTQYGVKTQACGPKDSGHAFSGKKGATSNFRTARGWFWLIRIFQLTNSCWQKNSSMDVQSLAVWFQFMFHGAFITYGKPWFSVSCNTTGDIEYDVMDVECPASCQNNYARGNGTYSVDSSVCAAANREGKTGIVSYTFHVILNVMR